MEKIIAKERQRLATLDRKIERLKEKVAVKHEEYNSLIKELSDLMDERYPERKEEHVKETLFFQKVAAAVPEPSGIQEQTIDAYQTLTNDGDH